MKIKLQVVDAETGKVLEELGTCVTDSPGRAVQMYADNEAEWLERGYAASIEWTDITGKS